MTSKPSWSSLLDCVTVLLAESARNFVYDRKTIMPARILRRSLIFVRDYWVLLIVLPLFAYWLDAYPEASAVKVAKWMLYIGAFVSPAHELLANYMQLRVWGGDISMLRALASSLDGVADRSVNRIWNEIGTELIVLGIVMGATALLFDKGWLSLGLAIFALGLSMLLRMIALPFLLFLARSTDANSRLASRLGWRIAPHRVVDLLRISKRRGATVGWRGESMRDVTVAGIGWKETVEGLMKFSKVIVLDCREVTTDLMEEATMVAALDFIDKTIFICDQFGRCELLASVAAAGGISPAAKVHVVPEQSLIPAVRRIAELLWESQGAGLPGGLAAVIESKGMGEVLG